ncbi:MAG: hypothetical protein ACRENE_08750 [Polyangiaceae bacterium]
MGFAEWLFAPVIPAGAALGAVHCRLESADVVLFQDTLTLQGGAPSFTLGNVPVGTGEVVDLIATSTDGAQTCSASVTFDVLAGQTTRTVPVFLCTPAPRDP